MKINNRESLCMVLVVAFLCAMINSLPAEIFGHFTYSDQEESVTITGYPIESAGNVVIPSAINNKPVKSIGVGAFSGCNFLTTVIIPDGVTNIERSAFDSCDGLVSIIIPSSVTSIGDDAFAHCGMTSINIPSGVVRIGNSAFQGCKNLASVTISAGITCISNNTFDHCTSLISVVIPAGVTRIGSEAFSRCKHLKTILIPGSVSSIGNAAFHGCDNLAHVSIPHGVTCIESNTFDHCTKLKYMEIPAGVASIGSEAFSGCEGLTSILIPASVTSIGENVFNSCLGLTAITVDAENSRYSSLEGVIFNKDRTRLIRFPCGKVGSFMIPLSVTSIDDYAFNSCAGLTSVAIPASVTSIGCLAFTFCTELKEIVVDALNTNYCSLDGVLFNSNKTTLIQCPGGRNGRAYIPAEVSNISDYAISCCNRLRDITVDPKNSKYSSFDGLLLSKNMTHLIQCPGGRDGSITILKGVTYIEDEAFYQCSLITSITIPASVTSIGIGSFWGCSSLTSVIFLGNAPQEAVSFDDASRFTIFYPNDKSGFTSPKWHGHKAEVRMTAP